MAEYVCKVWSADRRTKKTFMTLASTDTLIQAALNFDIKGSKIVLESDGTEVCGEAVLEHYLKQNETLMIIDNEEWCERAESSTSAAALQRGTLEQTNSNWNNTARSCGQNSN
ncbi:PREDICTED: uncharacterized protein LOC108361877 isoform X2 [Rhagoletis zephyria]|uniref:uncharacterized protein LOC108361877 isoform X2 n=1 Tax=Rhagoletis zephyria TaxID=28612 RepID=UPI00081150F2|nr:PREDICTED: uncharacterized protein LOC108361877 isoform X2 [Rhagoletis zephyria]